MAKKSRQPREEKTDVNFLLQDSDREEEGSNAELKLKPVSEGSKNQCGHGHSSCWCCRGQQVQRIDTTLANRWAVKTEPTSSGESFDCRTALKDVINVVSEDGANVNRLRKMGPDSERLCEADCCRAAPADDGNGSAVFGTLEHRPRLQRVKEETRDLCSHEGTCSEAGQAWENQTGPLLGRRCNSGQNTGASSHGASQNSSCMLVTKEDGSVESHCVSKHPTGIRGGFLGSVEEDVYSQCKRAGSRSSIPPWPFSVAHPSASASTSLPARDAQEKGSGVLGPNAAESLSAWGSGSSALDAEQLHGVKSKECVPILNWDAEKLEVKREPVEREERNRGEGRRLEGWTGQEAKTEEQRYVKQEHDEADSWYEWLSKNATPETKPPLSSSSFGLHRGYREHSAAAWMSDHEEGKEYFQTLMSPGHSVSHSCFLDGRNASLDLWPVTTERPQDKSGFHSYRPGGGNVSSETWPVEIGRPPQNSESQESMSSFPFPHSDSICGPWLAGSNAEVAGLKTECATDATSSYPAFDQDSMPETNDQKTVIEYGTPSRSLPHGSVTRGCQTGVEGSFVETPEPKASKKCQKGKGKKHAEAAIRPAGTRPPSQAKAAAICERRRVCEVCGQLLTCKASLERHLLMKHGDMRHTCQECGKVFKLETLLNVHFRKKHSSEPLISCDKCDTKFLTRRRYLAHQKLHLDGRLGSDQSGDSLCKCSICGGRFRRRDHYRRHMATVHCSEKKFQCLTCGKTFSRQDHLYLHQKRHQTEATDRQTSGIRRKLPSGTFYCRVCGESFSSLPLLGRHCRQNHKQPRCFRCQQCPGIFSSVWRLHLHMTSKHGARADVCFQCGVAPLACRFRAHLKSCVSSKNQLRCQGCAEVFDLETSLARHLRMTHLDADKKQCGICGKRCRSLDLARMHVVSAHSSQLSL